MPQRFLRSLLVAFASICLIPALLQAQPTISRTEPGAVLPGGTTELTVHGTNLTADTKLWTSLPATLEILPVDPKSEGKQLTCRITLPPDAGVGVGGLVAGDASGVSEIALLPIDDLPSLSEASGNNSLEKAQPIDLPSAVDATASGVQSDFYRFRAMKAQRLSLEVLARRIQSPMDPVLRLLAADGRELANSDDDAALGADCRLQHVFETEGDYVVEIRDNRYQAGGRYRLRVGDFPLVNTTYPLGVTRGGKQELHFTGPAAEGVPPVQIEAPATVAGGRLHVAARYPDGNASAIATVASTPLKELTEAEPNDDLDHATTVSLPAALNGRLEKENDKDYFAFQGVPGVRYRFQAVSRSLRSPTLVFLQLFKADGAKLAESAIGAEDELFLEYTFPDDEPYRLFVEDLLHRGGPGHAYRIEAAPKYFTLALKNEKDVSTGYVAPVTNGAFAITIACQRLGYDGPIDLRLEEGTAGLEILNPQIPAKAKEHRTYIRVSSDATPGGFHVLQIIGEAKVGEQVLEEPVQTEAILRTKQPHVAFPPAWRNGLLRVALGTEVAPFFTMKPETPKVLVARPTGQGQLTLTLDRSDEEFKSAVNLLSDAAPSATNVAIKQDKDSYVLTLTGAAGVESNAQIRLLGYGEHKGRGILLPIEIPVEVIDPLTVELELAGPLTAGQKQKVTVRVERQGDDPQPVTIKWTQLPAGITAPEVTIAADQTEATTEFTAAADATAGKSKNLSVQAHTKFQGQDISVEKSGVEVETLPAS